MSNDLEDVIRNYLKEVETDYAYLLNGEWGSGKTYYVKSQITDLVESTPVPSGKEGECYQVIYRSVNGVRDLERFHQSINLERLSGNKNSGKLYDMAYSGGKGLVDSFLKKLLGKEASDNLQQASDQILAGKVSPHFFLVVDDLERLPEPEKNLMPLLGSIFERHIAAGTKVLYVANEDEIKDSSEKKFQRYHDRKEKTIRRTLPFQPDLSSHLDGFIKSRYEKSLAHLEITLVSEVGGNASFNLIDTFRMHLMDLEIRNLRTVGFIGDCLVQVFDSIYKQNKNVFEDGRALFFIPFAVTVYAYEYKLGTTLESLNEAIERYNKRVIQLNDEDRVEAATFTKPSIGDDEPLVSFDFIQKQKREFHHIQSIANYVYSGVLEHEALIQEVQSLYLAMDLTPEAAFSSLLNYSSLKEEQFPILVDSIMDAIDDGSCTLTLMAAAYPILKLFERNEHYDFSPDLDERIHKALERHYSGPEHNYPVVDTLKKDSLSPNDPALTAIRQRLFESWSDEMADEREFRARMLAQQLSKGYPIETWFYFSELTEELLLILFSESMLESELTLNATTVLWFEKTLRSIVHRIEAKKINFEEPARSWDKLGAFRDFVVEGIKQSSSNGLTPETRFRKARLKELKFETEKLMDKIKDTYSLTDDESPPTVEEPDS